MSYSLNVCISTITVSLTLAVSSVMQEYSLEHSLLQYFWSSLLMLVLLSALDML